MSVQKTGLSILQIIVLAAVVISNAWTLSPLLYSSLLLQNAKKSSSTSNLKQLALGYMQYVQDWDQAIPDSRASAGIENPSRQQIVRFLTAKPDPNLPTGTNPGYIELLRPYLSKPDTVVFSPADIKKNTSTYWLKYAIDKSAVAKGTVSLYTMKSPESSILLYENSPYNSGYIHGNKDGAKIMSAFLDGHVEEITIRNGPITYPLLAEQYSGEAATRLGSPMFFNCRNGIQHPGVADYDNPLTDTDSY
jgi:hypothetical protein